MKLFLGVALTLWLAGCSTPSPLGEFEGFTDVGNVRDEGSVKFDPGSKVYTMTGGGANMWAEEDAFAYLWLRISGDVILTTDMSWTDTGGDPHRKAGWIVRQDLEPDAPYADAVIHGDGLISLQYRQAVGGITEELQSPVKAPATLRLQRAGHQFSLQVAPSGGDFQSAGAVTVVLSDPVYVGLLVCAHDTSAMETAVFSHVRLESP